MRLTLTIQEIAPYFNAVARWSGRKPDQAKWAPPCVMRPLLRSAASRLLALSVPITTQRLLFQLFQKSCYFSM
jgi:hypothetical protein